MKKLHLLLDDLHVESFVTHEHPVTIGTLHGYAREGESLVLSCKGSCVNSCGDHNLSCHGSCKTCDAQNNTCQGTCNQTCDALVASCVNTCRPSCDPIVRTCGNCA